jgi:integrase
VLRVVETYDETAGRIKAYPKGKRVRDVPLVADLVTVFEGIERDGVCGVAHALGRCPGPLALTTEEGAPLRNSNWAFRVWTPAVRAAGVGHVRIHDCRHSYASWLLQEGISLAEVGRLLGHVSPQTTQRYAHLAETPSAAVLAALGAHRG